MFIVGFIQIYNRHSVIIKKICFANEYRNKFIEFSTKYFANYDRWNCSGNLDSELYDWLTMNVIKIQNYVGSFGKISYKPAYQNYYINEYQAIINTIPKFRESKIERVDAGAVNDCLLRYIGYMVDQSETTKKNLKNPIIWFRFGVLEILGVPIFVLSWFGIISNKTVNFVKDSLIYKLISGLIALVAFISGVVTIIVGYEQAIEFIKKIVEK